jgi:4-carboxymuconolactone decarboxylase
MLFEALDPSHASGGSVAFEPGARTAWHSHPGGQILIVTAGTGRVQQWGRPIEEIRAGDVVRIPAGQKHWHGASPQASMTHIAITEPRDGTSVQWMEEVSDEQYTAAPSTPQPQPSTQQQRTVGSWLQQKLAPGLAALTDGEVYSAMCRAA